MKKTIAILIALQSSIFSWAQAQISDDFSDGDIRYLPTWLGDTANFTVNTDQQLQLMAPAVTGNSYVATLSEVIDEAEWSFFVKLDFNPSSSNYMDIYLVSDQQDLTGTLNGYFVRIGNTQDEISLYKQSGLKSTAIKIIDGLDKRIDASQVKAYIKVTKSPAPGWELLADTDLSGNYISEGLVVDTEHFHSRYFGIVCTYTSTRADKFFLDDLTISGKAFSDDTRPEIDTLIVTSDSTIQILFSEKLQEQTATNTANYLVDQGIGNPSIAKLENDSVVVLRFQNHFEDKVENILNIQGIEDPFGNVIDATNLPFTYVAPAIAGFNDIIITEIMADPTPGVDLPEYEYLEVYNPGPEQYHIQNMKLVVGDDMVVLPDFSIFPQEYIIFCQSAAVDHLASYGRVLKVPNWPSLNNGGESITMYDGDDKLIFSIAYNNSWYKSLDKDDGGWSLEMIDTDYPCKNAENWMASKDPSGGTPGKTNSFTEKLTDLRGPEITRAIAISETSILVFSDEKLGPQDIDKQQITITPDLEVMDMALQRPEYAILQIDLSQPMAQNTNYSLTITNLHDCVGNVQKQNSTSFVLPEMPDSLDLLINEILFNPRSEGVDFVELYNQSEKYIDLKSVEIANDDDIKGIISDHFIIAPKQFLVLTENPGLLINQYPDVDRDKLLQMEKLPAFNDDEGEVLIKLIDGPGLDYFWYSDDFHSAFLQETEGVSLERISFTSPSNNPTNWHSAASTTNFASPGKMNSQSMPDGNDNSEVWIEPQVFAPGNTSFPAFTNIKCHFAQAGNMANIKIVDAHGRVVKTILSHQSIGSEESFKWEGENDQGSKVRMGPYLVYLEIYNADGAKKLYRKKVVVGGRM